MAEIKIADCFGNRELAYKTLEKMGARDIQKLPNGKPVASNCFISISHSRGKTAVCKSEKPIGIDIEKIENRNFNPLAERFFTENEKKYFNENGTAAAFYEIWTRKEAHAKITGDGLKEIFRMTDTFSLNEYDFTTKMLDGYVLTVCEKK